MFSAPGTSRTSAVGSSGSAVDGINGVDESNLLLLLLLLLTLVPCRLLLPTPPLLLLELLISHAISVALTCLLLFILVFELTFALLDEEGNSCLLCGDIDAFVFGFKMTLLGLLFPLRVNIRFADGDVDCAALAYSKNCCCSSNLERNYIKLVDIKLTKINKYTNASKKKECTSGLFVMKTW